jgi:hypothetical protein
MRFIAESLVVEAEVERAHGGIGRAWWKRTRVVGSEVGGLGEVVVAVAGCSFMLMAIENYEVRYPLLVLAHFWNLLRVGAGVVSGRAWWKRTRVAGAKVGGLGEVVVAGCSFMLMAIEKYEVRYSVLRQFAWRSTG